MNNRRLRSRKVKVFLIFGIFFCIIVLSGVGAGWGVFMQSDNDLQIQKIMSFPIREVSGLSLSHHGDENQKLFAVGDKYAEILMADFDIKNKDIVKNLVKIDFTKILTDHYSLCASQKIDACRKFLSLVTSQWEGISVDSASHIFLLHEQLATIFVLDPLKEKIISTFNLESFNLPEEKENPMHAFEKNALGEGLVLLKNGHFLVIKEKADASIVEFGRRGEVSQGYSPELALNGTPFPLKLGENKIELIPLKKWVLAKNHRNCDLSELSVDKTGELYVMSQTCQWIAHISHLKVEEPSLKFEQSWGLPKSIRNGEAFVVLGNGNFLVAEDRKDEKRNMFLLSSGNKAL